MRVRTVIIGVLAGVICLVVLRLAFYMIELPKIVPDWPTVIPPANFPAWAAIVIVVFCGITLFTFGWVAARWNWGRNWQASLQSGMGMGLLAGCLIFDFVGVSWYSLKGQSQILMNYYVPLSKMEGTRILVEAIMQTGLLLYTNFILVISVCAVLGGLGGLASAFAARKDFWGTDPRQPGGWLFHLPAYLLTISGSLSMIVTIAVLKLLWEKTINSAIELDKQYDVQWSISHPAEIFLLFGYLVGLTFVLLPVGVTWGWIARAWYIKRRPGVLSALWVLTTAAGVAWLLWRFITNGSIFAFRVDVIILMLVLMIGLIIGLITRERSAGSRYRFSDWIGYGLTFGILGGTQIVMGVVAYAVALAMIAIVNIPHLVKAEPVEKAPVDQVISLLNLQNSIAINIILAGLVIGLIVAGLVSFVRNVTGMRDVSPVKE